MNKNEKDNHNSYTNNYLREAFKNLKKSQTDVISDLKKSQPYVSALMNGKKQVGKGIAKQLSILYGFHEGSILTGGVEQVSELSEEKEINTNYPEITDYFPEESVFNNLKIEDKMNVIYKQNLHLRNTNEDLKEKIEDLTLLFEITMAPILRHFKLKKDDDHGNNLVENATN